MKPQKNIIVACTGSVATIKLPMLIRELQRKEFGFQFNIKVVITKSAKHFFELTDVPADVAVLDNSDEWITWNKRGDPVVHIELSKWADLMLIAPLSANSLAKIATGICDSLLLCIVRAWNMEKPLLFCPAMNTRMYEHPITREHITKLQSWGYYEIECLSKTLMCGDIGNGAMAEVQSIVKIVVEKCQN